MLNSQNDEKMLIAKSLDKYEFCITKNKITYTDFLTITEQSVLKKALKENNINNYITYGGMKGTDRSLIIFYPEKLSIEMVEKNFVNIFKIVRIVLPTELKYEHREYLSGVMKLGLRREKIGDIVVNENGADIICLSDISNILENDLRGLTRFRKSTITVESINNINYRETEFEKISIIVSSLRLDNFVSELSKTSRTRSEDIIKEGRVFVNSINETKDSKKINVNDIITIRGKGKFIFDEIERKTSSDKLVIKMRKYK